MSVINDSKDYFYLGLQNKKEQIDLLWPGVENLESTQFYELCQKYSDIALNAIKQRIPGTCDVQGCFQFADIEIAKRATKDYVVDWEIEDVDTLLSLIHEFIRTQLHGMTRGQRAGECYPKTTTTNLSMADNTLISKNYPRIFGGTLQPKSKNISADKWPIILWVGCPAY